MRFKDKFDLFDQVDVNGPNAHPLFTYLKTVLTGTITNDLKWNFTKFLIDRNGNPVKRYAPTDEPNSFEPDINNLIHAPGTN